MNSSIWKRFCLTLNVAATVSVTTAAYCQSPLQDSGSGSISTIADEQIFDTKLLSTQPGCITLPSPNVFNPNAPAPTTVQPTDPNSPIQAPASPLQAPSANMENTFNSQQQQMGALAAGQGALTGQNSIAASMMVGGYLDPAAPVTTFRLRYDDAINNKFPDRGEYFYAKCGCFRDPVLAGGLLDPKARGPQGLNASVSYQDVRPYMEYAFSPKFSVFTELPFRFVDFNSLPTPVVSQQGLGTEGGLSDMNVGFKYAFIAETDRYVTWQVRTYIPTGNSELGLGTGHVSIENSLLYYRRLSDRWLLQGQLTEFAPVDVTGFASNVLQYGGGLGYILTQQPNYTIVPTVEAVGWTFLGGHKFNDVEGGYQSASGDTIINIKPGVRVGFGSSPGPMMMQRQSVYAGFGIPITDDQFYTNLFRVEYRMLF